MELKITLRNILLIATLTFSSFSFATKITAKPGGGNWNAPGTWDLGRVPTCGDTIVVPPGVTVHIPSNVTLDGAGCAPVTLQVAGSLTFANGKKLRLSSGGCVQISVSGSIVPSGVGGGASELIEIGGQDWWQASDGTLLGSSLPAGVVLGCGILLPVELSSFEIEYLNETATLNFSTASERNLLHFIVEISKDGSFWQELGVISAVGNSETTQSYSIVDKNPFIGVSYYKLTSVNVDGTKSELDILTGEFTSKKYLLYPIPVNKMMFVEGDDLENSKITIVNSLGENLEVENTFMGDKLSYNFSEVKSGVYFLVIENDNVKKTERIVVVHK